MCCRDLIHHPLIEMLSDEMGRECRTGRGYFVYDLFSW